MIAFVSPRTAGRPAAWLAVLVVALTLTMSPAAGVARAADPAAGTVEITTQAAYRFQGWGTSLAWWANVVGGWQGAGQVEDALFGTPDRQHPDRLGLTVLRYDLGASPVLWCPAGATTGCSADPSARSLPVADASLVPSCRSFRPGAAVPVLASGPGERPDLARDRNQVAVLRAALARGRRDSFALEAFANSAPWWLTVSGCPQGNRDATDPRDNLAPEQYGAYAAYLSSALQAFRREGIVFDTVDPLNEPENPWGQDNNPYTGQPDCTSNCQEGMHFGPEPPLRQTPSLGPLLATLCAQLAWDRVTTGVSFPDGFNPSDTAALLTLTGPLPGCVTQLNTHMYDFIPPNGLVPYGQGFSIYDPTGTSGGRKALNGAAQALSRRLWTSEFGIGGAAADLSSGLAYSSIIAADMRWLRPTAWVHWQAVEATGGWGLFESPTFPLEGPLTRTRRFSALAQYSRFIRPGYQVLTTLDPADDPVHETTATMAAMDDLRHPRRIVIVGTNTQATAREVAYDLAGLNIDRFGPHATISRYRTSAGEDVRPLGTAPLSSIPVTDSQPPGSITTYVIDVR